jgi:hypothetical protein
MVNIKGIAKKYDVEINDLDSVYYSVYKQLKKLNNLNEDLFNKYMQDKLQEFYMDDKDIYSLSDYYTQIFIDEENNKLADKIINSEQEPIDIIKSELNKDKMDGEVIQTSGEMSQVIGRNRPVGYKKEIINMYNK